MYGYYIDAVLGVLRTGIIFNITPGNIEYYPGYAPIQPPGCGFIGPTWDVLVNMSPAERAVIG